MKSFFQKSNFIVLAAVVFVSYLLFPHALFAKTADQAQVQAQAAGKLDCKMIFNFKSWSIFFNSGKGEGSISCNDGEKTDVLLSTKGGGVFDFGKSDIINGHGQFTPVQKLDELFGSYSASGANVGVAKSAAGLSLSKTKGGMVSIDLSGTGAGVDIGFHFGDFKIEPKKPAK